MLHSSRHSNAKSVNVMVLCGFMQAEASSTGVIITRTGSPAYQPTTANSSLTIHLQAEPPQTPLIAHFLPPELPRVEDLPLQGIDVTSGALAFEFSHDRIAEAFDRLQDDIKQWSTVLVDSADAASAAVLPDDLQLLQQEQRGTEPAVSGEGVEGRPPEGRQTRDVAQSAASEQGSADTASTSGDAGKESLQ